MNKHLSKVVQYNVPNGKKNRGMSVPVSYKMMVPEAERTEESVRLANVLGWCVEFVSEEKKYSFLLVLAIFYKKKIAAALKSFE